MGAVNDSPGLSHLDADGRARMVDIGGKPVTVRVATATGRYLTRPDVIALVRADDLPKADVLTTARLAGIGGAKRTSELVPLCHPLPLDSISVDFALEHSSIVITATARTTGRTGVEMEALTAVAVAGLTLHDMVKAADPSGVLTEVMLVEKTGGKHGTWTRDGAGAEAPAPAPAVVGVRPRTAAVLVASTSGAAGARADTTGPAIADWLAVRGFAVDEVRLVDDAHVGPALASLVAARPAVIISTGGTGVSPTDRTPEAALAVIDRELPGIAEAIRSRGVAATPTAALSRGVAGVANGTVVVTLPGSTGGVRDGLAVLDGLLEHVVAQVAGGGTHE